MLFYVPEHTIPLKKVSIPNFAIVAKDGLSDLALWRHHRCPVTSREHGVLSFWRHIRGMFLHAQITAKAILTSD